jgi:hypothetical protein
MQSMEGTTLMTRDLKAQVTQSGDRTQSLSMRVMAMLQHRSSKFPRLLNFGPLTARPRPADGSSSAAPFDTSPLPARSLASVPRFNSTRAWEPTLSWSQLHSPQKFEPARLPFSRCPRQENTADERKLGAMKSLCSAVEHRTLPDKPTLVCRRRICHSFFPQSRSKNFPHASGSR